MHRHTTRTAPAAGVCLAIVLTSLAVTAEPGESLTIPGRAYEPAQLDPANMCPSPAAMEMFRRRLVREFDPDSVLARPRSAGTMDIGEIAVIEDDGTLVSASNVTNSNAIINTFLAARNDEWDYVIIYISSDYPGDVQIEGGAFAVMGNVSNYATGINISFQGPTLEDSGFTRLIGVINMNDLPEYPADPTEDFFEGFGSAVEILGHEIMHAYSAFIAPPLGPGASMKRDGAHWNPYLHHNDEGNASPMYGGRWQDNGDGSFTALESFTGYSKIDEYLAGLRSASEVSPFFTIGNSPTEPPNRVPLPGFVALGDRVDITIDDIIAAHGPRFPTPETTQKKFRGAFVLVVPPGQTASAEDLAKLNLIRTEFENYFRVATNFRGEFDTRLSLDPGVDPASFPIEDDFEGGLFDSGIWDYVQGVTLDGSPLNPPSGTGALRFDGNWGRGDEVRSITIDLSDQTPGDAALEYWAQRTGGGASPNADENLRLEYFNDSEEWVTLRIISGTGPDQTDFDFYSEVIPADGLHDQFRFRFQRTRGRFGAFGDFFLDDLRLVANVGAPCPGDLSGSGSVGSEDLAILLGGWGSPGPADLSGSGTVGSADLAILLGLWGPCP